jgi:hypothetical protein
MVYLAFEVMGFWSDKSLRTLIALVSLSPEAPVKIKLEILMKMFIFIKG